MGSPGYAWQETINWERRASRPSGVRIMMSPFTYGLLKDEFCGANNGSGVAEACPNNGHGNQGSQQFLTQGKLHGLPPELAGVGQTTGNHDGFGVKNVDESAQGLTRRSCADVYGAQGCGAVIRRTWPPPRAVPPSSPAPPSSSSAAEASPNTPRVSSASKAEPPNRRYDS